MRPLVSPSVTLAAAALAGVAVLAGLSLRPDGRVTPGAPAAAADATAPAAPADPSAAGAPAGRPAAAPAAVGPAAAIGAPGAPADPSVAGRPADALATPADAPATPAGRPADAPATPAGRPADAPAAPDAPADAPIGAPADPPSRVASPGSGAAGLTLLAPRDPPQQPRPGDLPREFYFTRAMYSGGGFGRGWGRRSWATDYPKADRQFLVVVERLLNVDLHPGENAVRLDDPELRRFPFLYALEVGAMRLSPAEVEGLRGYLEAGGFLVIDDFWGVREWANFEREIGRVLPGSEIVELPMDHPVFHAFYNIDEVLQVPAIGRGISGRPTWEQGGRVPHVRGIHDERGRLAVLINFNTDLGDAWEHAENPYYPLEYSTYAYQMGVNMIVYAMTH